MRKIRLSDTDLSLFDEELSPAEFIFFNKHKETFCCMMKDQGKSFWTRFTIVFRSYTVHHGIIQDMPCDSTKIQSMLDHAFITIHEHFVDAKINAARAFILNIALVAQNKDKFPYLDSRSFTKDPFYSKETRDVFRLLFGPPDKKSSYIQVYILSPVYLRFGGSVCRCLMKWLNAEDMDPSDDSYWTPPAPSAVQSTEKHSHAKQLLCEHCIDDCATMYLKEKFCGDKSGPKYLSMWLFGDPRFIDSDNPLYNPQALSHSDWRDKCEIEDYQAFVAYVKTKYQRKEDECVECLQLQNEGKSIKKTKKKKKKKKKKTLDEKDVPEAENADEPSGAQSIYDVGEEGDTMSGTWPFSSYTKRTESVVYNIISSSRSGVANANNGFSVVQLDDSMNKCYETTITIAGSKDDSPTSDRLDFDDYKCLATPAAILRAKIPNLPSNLELYKGDNCCVAVLNYDLEEATNPSCFNVKVAGYNNNTIMSVLFQLLRYIGKRKQRPCPGWRMVVEDILACILPDEACSYQQLSISLQRGFHPVSCLANYGKQILLMNSNSDVVLMNPDDGGGDATARRMSKDELIAIVDDVCQGIAMELKEFVVMKDGTIIHMKTGGPPVIDIRGCSEREKLISDGLPIDFKKLVASRKAERPIWDVVTADREKYDVLHINNKAAFADCSVTGSNIRDYFKKDGYAVIGYSSKWLYTLGDEKTNQEIKSSDLLKKQVKKHESVKKTKAITDDEYGRALENEKKLGNPWRLCQDKKSEPYIVTAHAGHEQQLEKPQQRKKRNITVQYIHVSSCRRPDEHHRGCLCCEVRFTMQIEKKNDRYWVMLSTSDCPDSKIDRLCGMNQLNSTIGSALCEQVNKLMPFLGLERIDVQVKESHDDLRINLSMFGCSREPPHFSFCQASEPGVRSRHKNKCRNKGKSDVVFTITTKVSDVPIPAQHPCVKVASVLSEKNYPQGECKIPEVLKYKHRNPQAFSQHKSSDVVDDLSTKLQEADLKAAMMETTSTVLVSPRSQCEVKSVGDGPIIRKLRICSNCHTEEDRPKQFKKCQRCKEESIPNARYYCGKECQVSDWVARHKQGHVEGTLQCS